VTQKKDTPPLLGEKLLKLFLPKGDSVSVAGDYEELYTEIVQSRGKFMAYAWYWTQIVKSIWAGVTVYVWWSLTMFKNYLKIAVRNIKRHKGYSFINIAGLSVGLTCCILILLYVKYEFSYDKYHENANNIYRVVMKFPGIDYMDSNWFNASPGGLKAALMEDFPEVIYSTRATRRRAYIYYDNNPFEERGIFFIDPEFFKIFSFPLISGDPETAVKEPFSMLITQKVAKKYFGNENPVGKKINVGKKYDYKVTGILENCPENSHFTFDILTSFNSLYTTDGKDNIETWNGFNDLWNTYLQLPENYNPDYLESKFPEMIKKYGGEDFEGEFHLQPLTSIHLHSNINFEIEANGNILYIYLFSAIAFFIMMIACLNYMNLATARAASRFKEIGIRKVVGAGRRHIRRQFLGESMIFTLTAFFISIIFVQLSLPSFGSFIDRNLEFNFYSDFPFLIYLVCMALFVGLISGSYPAFYMSTLKPINIIKGALFTGSVTKKSSAFRNSLVVIQFVISIVMIVCTLTVYNQLVFIKNSNLGFTKEHIITGNIFDNNLRNNLELFKTELSRYPQILDVYVNGDLPVTISASNYARWEGFAEGEEGPLTYGAEVNYNFLDFFEIELIEGRNFSKEFTTDTSQAFILNETAVKITGWDEPIGKKYSLWGRSGYVIGVIKDFHNTSLHLKVEPIALWLTSPNIPNILNRTINDFAIKIGSSDIPGTLAFIEDKFKEHSPDYLFNFSFLDERVDRLYRSEQRLGRIFTYFTFIAIFISCLGLFGLASFTTEQRTKEIGIRKVLGASISGIMVLLSREFVKWVLAANVIAIPIAYIAMNRWLQNFAYRAGLGVHIFLFAALLAFFIAVITVSFKSFKSALANPVDSLRYE
jgi:putative ABC transport system permease protein